MAITLRTAKLALGVAALLLLVGCPRQVAITLCNNSGKDLVIQLDDGPLPWPAGACPRVINVRIRLRWEGRASGGATVPILDVLNPSQRFEYNLDLFPLPPAFATSTGGVEVFLQLEPNARLYLVSAKERLPTSRLPNQSGKFPIEALRITKR